MNNFEDIDEHSIYPDLIRCLAKNGHNLTVLLPREKKFNDCTTKTQVGNINIIRVRTGNLFDVGMVTKLISRSQICRQYKNALLKYSKDIKFDLILSCTPPTILYPLINKIKKRDDAYSYLMLKDIFPQNAVDLGMIKNGGLLHKFFRHHEKKLYKSSDRIGCMSPANVQYLLKQDSWIPESNVAICPNALEIKPFEYVDRDAVRDKYNIPKDKVVIVYGGGLGKPQGIDFLIECIKKLNHNSKYMFVVMGSGPYAEILTELSKNHEDILKVIPWLPVDEFNNVVASSDIGLILLDYRFNIPNFPSRLLAYLQAGIPVISATDANCDIGTISEENGFGYWCISKDSDDFIALLSKYENIKVREQMGLRAREFFEREYNVEKVAEEIVSAVKERGL